ncbi:hypothetical protein HZA86_01215 [Candidatus Uhrbacteria bacterium]|nr:hypothetical protein [Candidatus Uhrbacteria bacterium]
MKRIIAIITTAAFALIVLPVSAAVNPATRPEMRRTLTISVTTDSDVYFVGDAPRVTISLTNISDSTVVVSHPMGCDAGLSLDWQQLLWHCDPNIGSLTIAPGQTVNWVMYFDKGIGPGWHSLTGWVNGYGNATVTVRVLP